MGDFRKLGVWSKAHEVALAVYKETSRWPRHELYGLTSQARRAADSVAANLAEGCGKSSDAELAKPARSSLGSAAELAYYMILAHTSAIWLPPRATICPRKSPRSNA